MSILTWLAGPYIDITPLDYPELYQDAACDKHRELVEAAEIEALQRRIVERGGVVRNVGAYYTPEPLSAAIESGSFVTPIAQHVERLKERKQ